MLGPRPNFTGQWAFNRARSVVRVDGLAELDDVDLRIIHSDPILRVQRRFVLRGQEHAIDVELIADGQERTTIVAGEPRRVRLTWEGASLIFVTRMAMPHGEGLNTVQYVLSDDGRELEAAERFRSETLNYDNHWVFDRR